MIDCPVCTAPVRLTWASCPECGSNLGGTPPAPAPTAAEVPAAEVTPGMTVCLNHPRRAATSACSVCAEAFCSECVDHPGAAATCKSCLAADPAAAGAGPGVEPLHTAASKLAQEALVLSLVGIVCFGIILEPLALYKAVKARRQILASPLPVHGAGKATAAIVIASILLGLWVLAILANVLVRS